MIEVVDRGNGYKGSSSGAVVRGTPAARTTRRAVWRVAHKGTGYAVLGVGVYQALSGRALMPSQGDAVLVAYVVLLGHSVRKSPAGGQ